MKIRPTLAQLFPTEGQKDKQDEARSTLSNFKNAPTYT
jgi:hypothetical protein